MSKGYSAHATDDVQAAIKNLREFLRTLETVPTQELHKSAATIKAEATAQAPYETGKLEKSIYVNVTKHKNRPTLTAGARAYSKQGYDYAGIQHEDTSFHHPGLHSKTSDPGRAAQGKAHYLSDPFNAEIDDLKLRLRKKVRVKTRGR